MNALQLMDFFQDFYKDFDRQRAEDMLQRLGLDKKQKLRQMSKGTREKVQLIMVMSRKAKLYLLDEPIGGVDPATRDYILDKTLDEVLFINRGRIMLQASVDDIRQQYGKSVDEYFREVFKC